jgi:hypothetical protein
MTAKKTTETPAEETPTTTVAPVVFLEPTYNQETGEFK